MMTPPDDLPKEGENTGDPSEGVVLPPLEPIAEAKKQAAKKLTELNDVRQQLADVYRKTRTGAIPVEVGTKLVYILDKLTAAIRADAEVEALQKQFEDAWSGMTVKLVAAPKAR